MDTSIQNGVMEHILSVTVFARNAKVHNLTLATTFVDLQNVFGSFDMLSLVKIPNEVTSYIKDNYVLTTFSTKSWTTTSLKMLTLQYLFTIAI